MATHLEAGRIRASSQTGRQPTRSPLSPASVLRIGVGGLAALLSAALLGELVYHYAIGPRLSLRHVVVQGDALSQEEILHAAGIELPAPLRSVDPTGVREALEAIPRVKRATVEVRGPDTLVVVVEARKGIATALVPDRERSIPVVFDEDGVIFAVGDEAADTDLPVLSGLTFARYTPGTRLPAVLDPLLDDLRALREQTPPLYALLSEVRITRTSDRAVELLVYTTVYDTPVRTGEHLTADLLKNAALLLDVLRRERMEDRVAEIDLRAREVVYRERGGE